jgi:hypothetical protein
VLLGLIARGRSPVVRARLYAAAAALLFALGSALLAATVSGFARYGIGGRPAQDPGVPEATRGTRACRRPSPRA